MLPLAGLLVVVNILDAVLARSLWPLVGVAAVLACFGIALYASRRGKFIVWARLLDGMDWRGDERVLDIGCGRGAVLLMAAEHLTTGRAVGVDLWKRKDQSGNSIDAAQRNAEAEHVADRVELHTADMTALPFADESFDLVVSNIAIHNVPGRARRQKAVEEAVRVLRPGGRLMIADLWGTRQYCRRLTNLGMLDITRRRLGWRMWWGGPWAPTRLVTAKKSGTGILPVF